jgi:hypothetical protein
MKRKVGWWARNTLNKPGEIPNQAKIGELKAK